MVGIPISLRIGARSLGSFLPLLALALVSWWAATLERDQQSSFDRIAEKLTGQRLVDAGPIAIAACGPKGCADPSDTIYRFAVGNASCFAAAGAHLLGEPGGDLVTGMLVADERGRQSLLILDDDLRPVVTVATDGVASRPCPRQRRPPEAPPRI